MSQKAAITVNRPPEEVKRLWRSSEERTEPIIDAVAFAAAPGDRGTEIHVVVDDYVPLENVKDELRRFKQLAETGEVARSDATPEGEQAAHKFRQRPAQPLDESELEKVGV
jgi:hypothetical protein